MLKHQQNQNILEICKFGGILTMLEVQKNLDQGILDPGLNQLDNPVLFIQRVQNDP